MRILLLLAGLTLSLAAQPQEIYRWIDKDGQVHYADQPGAANAERVILADPNAYEAEPSFGDYAPTGNAPEDTDGDEAAPYESLAIVQPTPDQVFFGARVTYANQRGDERTITIKGIDEADNLHGEVSWISPIARALLKARVGDEVALMTPGGAVDKVQFVHQSE